MYWNVLKDHRNIQQVIPTTRWRPTPSPIVRRVLSRFSTFTFSSALVPLGSFFCIFFAADDGIMIVVRWECALLKHKHMGFTAKTQMTPKFVFSMLADSARRSLEIRL